MQNTQTIIPFGIHRNKPLSDPTIPLSYLKWLGKGSGYYEPGNRFEAVWHVPVVLMVLARREWENRTDERWRW